MTNKPKILASSSESDTVDGEKKKKKDTSDEASTSKSGRHTAHTSNSESDGDGESSSLTKMRPSRKTTKAKQSKPVLASDEDDQDNETKSESDSDFEKKITKKSTVTKKRQRSESEDSFNLDDESDSASDSGEKSKKKSISSAESGSEVDKAPKKRRRIKKASSSEGSDKEKDSANKGRKNIRKIVSKTSLEETTISAARAERERKQRIEERQKIYNQLYAEKQEQVEVLEQLVLDFDEKTKKPLIEVDRKLVKKLKPHQVNGIRFMWDACFESLERIEKGTGSGCILGHCMGLGKTLQVITLIHTLMMNQRKTGVERVLVVCPINIILNWVNEFKVWMKHVEKGKNDIEVFELSKFKKVIERAYKLNEWFEDGGVMIIGYDMYRNLSNEVEKKRGNKKVKDYIYKSLIDPGPDMIVCDEGHLLKNEKTSLSKAITKVKTLRRIVLTGTPLQNNLKEYYCMVQFVKPNLLGKYQEYMNRFVNPITNGQYTDSTDYDIKVMKRRAHVLHKMLDGCVQRRDYSVLAPYLPPKHEFVISIRLTKLQVELYKYYMENKARQMDPSKPKRASILFADFQNLQRIWTHPRVLRYNSDRYEQAMQKKVRFLIAFCNKSVQI
jgi:transcriptional regulator ATRX